LIVLENVSKTYGQRAALHPVTLSFAPRKTTVLIGPSGCGKSTVLRIIVGLVHPDSGSVLIEGVALTSENLQQVRHGIGYVIQEGGLFPHLTASDNVTLLARYLRKPRDEIDRRVESLAELAGIPPDALQRYPRQLSGGQRQRVGLMRALMLDPPILLLDEPLGALDPITRYDLQGELKHIFEKLGKTVIMVTHDIAEAAYFGDDITLLREGRIVQRGSFDDLLRRPAESYVSAFLKAHRMPVETAHA
jgi:osmoprotectant transport system ATP-binding protein